MTDTQERVRKYIMRNTKNHHNQKAIKEQRLKFSLCAHGDLEPKDVKTALESLGEQEVIQYGSGWIVPVVDKEYHREAIGYIVEHSTGDITEFVSVANKAIQDYWES